MLQTLAPRESYPGELNTGEGQDQTFNFLNYLTLLKRRIFYFLIPFGLVSIVGLCAAVIQKPKYLSEGKILVESAPDFVKPIVTASTSERIQRIQQQVMTRDNFLSIASKFSLFPGPSRLEKMRKSTLFKPAEVEGNSYQNSPTIAFTVGFEHENPEIAMRVANEFVTLIVDEDTRSRTGRETEAVKVLSDEAKDIEGKLESLQSQISEIARRPRDEVPEAGQENSQLTALAALKAELIQKSSVYSDAHPAVIALKKRIAAMEKSLTQSTPAQKARSTQSDELESAKRQREVLELRLADANSKLATARLNEKLNRDHQAEHFQVVEAPSIPLKPEKSARLKIVGIAFVLATAFGAGAIMARELFDRSIRSRDQLAGLVDSHLVVAIPYIFTRSDTIRSRLRLASIGLTIAIIFVAWGALTSAILFDWPTGVAWSEKTTLGLSSDNQ